MPTFEPGPEPVPPRGYPPAPRPTWWQRAWAALPESSKPDRAWLVSVGVLLVATLGFAAALAAWLAVAGHAGAAP